MSGAAAGLVTWVGLLEHLAGRVLCRGERHDYRPSGILYLDTRPFWPAPDHRGQVVFWRERCCDRCGRLDVKRWA